MTVNSGDILRVTAKMYMGVVDVQNVYHIQAQSTGEVSDEDAVDEIKARLNAAYAELVPQQTDTLQYDTIEIFNVTQDKPIDEVTWPTLTDGDVVGDMLPSQMSGLVRFTTQTARSQGRKFIGGVIEGDNDSDGLPDTDILTALADYAADLLAAWLVGSGSFAFGNYNVDLDRFAEWVSPIVNTIWSALGRRRFGQGS